MEFIKHFVEIFLHIDKSLGVVIQNFGMWTYGILFGIVFAETGLVVTPFLPGDSLLFAAGAVAATGALNVSWVFIIFLGAAIIGNTVNYAVGRIIGERVFHNTNSRIFKKEYMDRTHRFYEKYGGKTLIITRFVPIVRTFAPFVAGVGKMSFLRFSVYNIAGALLWVSSFVFGGFYFGNVPVIKKNFSLTVIAIIVLSILPAVIEFWKHRRHEVRMAGD